MIQISRSGNGFELRFKFDGPGARGYTVQARNVGEIHKSIDHHFRPDGLPTAEAAGHTNGRLDDCPLCRSMQEQT